jgi:organic hydroperoxide reductase OsmC/OhrA
MAHLYTAEVTWQRDGQDFLGNRFSRRHRLRFDGGVEVPGSSSPLVVPPPLSDTTAVDPEEMFVAALSSCHMLWFLAIAAKRRFQVERYADSPVGVMEPREDGKLVMALVTLRPRVELSGERLPTREEIDAVHRRAHDECYLANSVKTDVRCEPDYSVL